MRPLFPAAAFAVSLLAMIAGPPRALAAAPTWDYVYFPDTLPEDAPAGAWGTDHDPGQEPTLVGGRLSFNPNSNAKFYYRDDTLDPNFPTSTLTFEWKSETMDAGYYDMGVYGGHADATDLIFDGFVSGQQVLEYFAFYNSGYEDLPVALGKGAHTYRIVKHLSRADLYIDGELRSTRPTNGLPLYEIYLHVASFYEDPPYYTALWDHVAYTRGAYTPAELPSPARGGSDTEPPAAVADLRGVSASTNTVTLAWTAPGDDADTGTATSYDVRFTTTGPITADAEFNAATQADGEPAPQAAGSAQTFTLAGLAPGTTYYFALKTADEANNASALSNSPAARTQGGLELAALSPVNQDATVTKPLATALTVKVTEAGVPKSSVTVRWEFVGFPTGTAGQMLLEAVGFASTATVGAREGLTNADGEAAVSLKLGNLTGVYIVSATVMGAAPVQFRATGKVFLGIALSMPSISPLLRDGVVRAGNKLDVTVTAFGVGGATDTVTNYPVILRSTSMALSGGHDHEEGHRPAGVFVVGGSTVTSGITGADGRFAAVYRSSWTGGFEVVTASAAADAMVVSTSTIIPVKVIDQDGFDLVDIATLPLPFLRLTGNTGTTSYKKCLGRPIRHASNHWTSAETLSRAAGALIEFNNETGIRVGVNDMSLSSGGLFDICGNWRPGHACHRDGNSIDIDKSGLSKAQIAKLTAKMRKHGGERVKEPSLHYQFRGRENCFGAGGL